ncbi:DNA dC-_dU-editing enzyme APOBEC-3F-like isoform X2 [Nycticebus coucang]|uniref:DNA dC->dU-editing enzyme APOBEC-3F-like isoform X2 n=1 Tax=Nycticebus coucang TaxID=9470 RepID=UPI00234C0ED5|nr:DNA dC->dU-editing enzyme APOBEC-3F-like isoform X2 [Nycticebus coucang]
MNPPIRDPMDRMYPKTFYRNFEEVPCPSDQNSTWLCFEVETKNPAVSFHRGVFRNQGPLKTPCHAEVCFLTWIQEVLPPDHHSQVTWYVSRSPCASCANLIVHFLATHRRMTLTIFAAHLNRFWESDYQQGLLRMDQEGVQLRIMGHKEFEYCWDNFVYNQRKQFVPWNELNENCEFLVPKLEEILREPKMGMSPGTFSFHFNNRPILSFRNDTWLCFEVKRNKDNSCNSLDSGVFRNQGPQHSRWHTEVCFLTWVKSQLSRDHCYQVTWYLSWSPCVDCAWQVADFLVNHPNVSLTIYAARLYYFWRQDYRQGLLRMAEQGAQVHIMSSAEFEHCWENFVNSENPWVNKGNKLKNNYEKLVSKLDEIFSDPMEGMFPNTFHEQFNNTPASHGQKDTWLCFEVKGNGNSNSLGSFHRGVFRNQTRCHAEVRFLTWFQGMLSPDLHYQVTWYISWSPCPDCADLVADFLAKHRNVSLTIFAARLYYHRDPEVHRGLRRMYEEGAKIDIMAFKEFRRCWDNFVYNQSKQFVPWKGLNKNYDKLVTKLDEIFSDPMEGMFPNTFHEQFNNTLAPHGQKDTWLCFEVKGNGNSNSLGSFHRGVFRNQTPCHAEVRFLTWFQGMLSPDLHYQVTWYISWSPCADCADLVADFLAKHRNVSLTIFAARLYYHGDPEMHRGLLGMYEEGAEMNIMAFKEFRRCWDNFVYNQSKQFVPWKGLNKNCDKLVTKLDEIFSL